MEPTVVLPDNTPTLTPSPATTEDKAAVHRERRRDISAYLVCCGFPCTGFDGNSYTFNDPTGEVCLKAAGYNTTAPTVGPQPFLKALSDLGKMAERWEREHNPPSPEDKEPFIMIPKSFALDETLSATELALGVRLNALSDKKYQVYAEEKTLQKKYLKSTGINPIRQARSSLVKKGYLEKIRPTGDDGRFTGCSYVVTPKLRRRPTKA